LTCLNILRWGSSKLTSIEGYLGRKYRYLPWFYTHHRAELRVPKISNIVDKLSEFHCNLWLTNFFEIETAGYYALGRIT
jgi:hypothetical protein